MIEKVAIVIDNLGLGGAEKQAVLSAIGLARRGIDTVLISYGPDNEFELQLGRNGGVRFYQVMERGIFRTKRIKMIADTLKKESPDVVHCFKGSANIIGALACKYAGIQNIVLGHRGKFRKEFWSGEKAIFRRISLLGKAWIVNNEVSKRFVVEHFGVSPTKVYVVYNGIDLEDYNLNMSKKEARELLQLPQTVPIVSIIGNLNPLKNHSMFLRVTKEVLKKHPQTVFLVAGDGPLRERLVEESKYLGILGCVRFLGRIKEIPELLRATDIVLMTSISEGTPNALIEAGVMGVPVVSTDCGDISKIVIDGVTGYLVNVDDDKEMVIRVCALIENDKLRQQFGEQARKRIVEKFSLERCVDSLLRCYEKVV